MIGGLLQIGGDILDKLIPDKAERDKLKHELIKMEQEGELQELETRMSAIIMEAKSSDPWTSRARPSFLYVMYAMILFSIPMGILSIFNADAATQIADGMKAWLDALPSELYWLFGTGYTGYSIARSSDKKQIKKGLNGIIRR